ncbi:unnamed protein product, partial [Mesorhabditis belari]|uniref:Acid phosphatase n=1 Tax=Mesorhabditis belari TaxID=2138241 RepID=A0AAF3EGV3_9BILA
MRQFLLLILKFSVFLRETLADPELLNVQVIFRHGARTPIRRFKAIVPGEYEKKPIGALTTRGLRQQYETGLKLKSRYIDKYRLVSKSFNQYETLVLSAMDDRCLQSAVANMAGFYSNPELGEDWPFNWMPVPIHTGTYPDRIFEPGQGCPRYTQTKDERAQLPAFKEFEEKYQEIITDFVANTGEKWRNLLELNPFVDAMICAKEQNLTFPDWLTLERLTEARWAINKYFDYQWGHELNGERNELVVALRAGPMLKALISNFTQNSTHKYTAYSAHDSTLLAVLTALGKRTQYDILENDWPDYAATMVFELWKMDDGQLRVKFLYSYNSVDPKFHDFTNTIDGCPDEGMCPVKNIITSLKKFIPKNMDMACAVKDQKGMLKKMLHEPRRVPHIQVFE